MTYTFGVDIGGTNIVSVIMDRQRQVKGRIVVKSNPTTKEAMIQQVTTCIESLLQTSNIQISEVKGIGVGVPGKVDRSKGIAVYQNNLPWREFPIVDHLKDYFSLDNIFIDNDVYAAAWAEWKAVKFSKSSTFV